MLVESIRKAFGWESELSRDSRGHGRVRLHEQEPQLSALTALLISYSLDGDVVTVSNCPVMKRTMRLPREGVFSIAASGECRTFRGCYGYSGGMGVDRRPQDQPVPAHVTRRT